MDELNPEDKMTVYPRPQDPEVPEPAVHGRPGQFTGREGKQVPVEETVRAFKEILEGKHDDVPENNFYMKGGIDEIKE
jgi:F-type H+-transporting ATPase subunit beta